MYKDRNQKVTCVNCGVNRQYMIECSGCNKIYCGSCYDKHGIVESMKYIKPIVDPKYYECGCIHHIEHRYCNGDCDCYEAR